MGLYLDNGYLNIDYIVRQGLPFNFVVSGRGLGKTYGALKYAVENKKKFIFMRRTQSQLDIIDTPEYTPFKALNRDMNLSIYPVKQTKYNSGFYNHEFDAERGKFIPYGEPLGISAAVSTISNLRGFDASEIKLLILDEFIPEVHERPIKNEAEAFFNAVETINRNRELNGEAPLICLLLSNSNQLGNPYFIRLGIMHKAETMRLTGQEQALYRDRGLGIFMPCNSPIAEQKQNTALYKLTNNTAYSEMALNNQFEDMNNRQVKPMPIAELVPVSIIGELEVYKHKSERLYYVSSHMAGSPPKYGTTDIEIKRFRRDHFNLLRAYLDHRVNFEDATCEIIFESYIG